MEPRFRIHSDPDLLLQVSAPETAESVLIHEELSQERAYYTSPHSQTTEVEPAMVIVDREAQVVSWWSWKKVEGQGTELLEEDPGLATVKVGATGPNGIATAAGSSSGATGETWLVNVRPDPADIIPALLQGRTVRLLEMLDNAEVSRQHRQTGEREGWSPAGAPPASVQATVATTTEKL